MFYNDRCIVFMFYIDRCIVFMFYNDVSCVNVKIYVL
jgi:hypothetical protein